MPPKPSCWDIYNKEMSQLNRGDALWEPAPLSDFKCIQPGDVGYVIRGCFHLLFSAGRPLDGRQLGVDVPRTFKTLDVGPTFNTQPRSPGYLFTDNVQETNHPRGLMYPLLEPGSGISFQLTGGQGAALLTKHPTYREDVKLGRTFEEYTKTHYDSWVEFARECGHPKDVKPIIITGVDMTRDFAMIAYSNNGNELTAEFTTSAPGAASPWGRWRTRGMVHTNCGPQPSRPPSGNSHTETVSNEYHQCVFIRYYTVRKRLGIPRVIKAAAGPHDLGPGDRNNEGSLFEQDYSSASDSGLASSLFDDNRKDERSSVTSTDYELGVVIHNTTPDERDEFDTVADYVFRNSNAVSVLIHHRDIAILREPGGSRDLSSQLIEKLPPIAVDKNGVGTIGRQMELVAIKIVRRSDVSSQPNPEVETRRLDHEVQVWSSLHHEHILPLFKHEHTSFADYFVTQYCPAGSLFDILKRDGHPGIPHDDAGAMFRQVVRGLQYVHDRGYIHGDIKLENVLVDEGGVCRIAEFGIARRIGEIPTEFDQPEPEHPTQLGRHTKIGLTAHPSPIRHKTNLVTRHRSSAPLRDSFTQPRQLYREGSLPYASPELLRPNGRSPYVPHPAQDVWALGVMLYGLLTGRLPFMDPSDPRLQMKILHGAFEMPIGIGPAAERMLAGCLDVNVASRWTIAMVDEDAWGIGWDNHEDSPTPDLGSDCDPVHIPNRTRTISDAVSDSESLPNSCSVTSEESLPPGRGSRGSCSSSRSGSLPRLPHPLHYVPASHLEWLYDDLEILPCLQGFLAPK